MSKEVPDPEEFFGKKYPSSEEFINKVMYFFLEKGIGYHEFQELPVPYIFSMLKKHDEIQKEKKKNLK